MIAAALIAASVLAPSGVTAAIQADPVCLPVTAQPGHSYPLTVYVSGSVPLTLAVTPAHGSLERQLHQVPASWVSFAANPVTGPGEAAFTLTIAPDAEPGAYWSDVEAGTQGQAQPGSGAQAALGAAAATAIVFTVGPSNVPPPPCDALDLAYSTGQFPAWPTRAFVTSSWAQVFAREKPAPDPHASPTATSGAHSVPAVAYTPAANADPAANAPAGSLPKVPSDWPGWAILIGLALLGLAGLRRWLRS